MRSASLLIAVALLSVPCVFGLTHLPQNTTGWEWDLPAALIARDYSRAAYCDEASISSWNCLVCGSDFQVKHVISESSNPGKLQGYVGVSDAKKLIVIAYRGSTNLANWIVNANFAHIDSDFNDEGCEGCKIHKGWFNAYQDVSDGVIQAVKQLADAHPDYEILATGHSLGAAIAVHTAVDLCVNHGLAHRLNMVTFGEPRLGNENFALFCTQVVPGSTRIVHNRDLVPHLPSKEGLFPLDYHHEAREVWNTDQQNTVKVCDGSGEDDSCSKSVSLFRWSVSDHLWYLGAPSGCKAANVFTAQELAEFRSVETQVVHHVLSKRGVVA